MGKDLWFVSLQLVGSADTGGFRVGTNYRDLSIFYMLSFSAVSLSNVQIRPFRPSQFILHVTVGLQFGAKILVYPPFPGGPDKFFHRAQTRSQRPCL
jgi:hypothetical protein